MEVEDPRGTAVERAASGLVAASELSSFGYACFSRRMMMKKHCPVYRTES